jgi:hypothetical protein
MRLKISKHSHVNLKLRSGEVTCERSMAPSQRGRQRLAESQKWKKRFSAVVEGRDKNWGLLLSSEEEGSVLL